MHFEMGQDVLSLLAELHKGSLLRLAGKADQHIQGLQQGSRILRHKLRSRWQRRLREVEAAFGLARHITPQSVRAFLAELDVALDGDNAIPVQAGIKSEGDLRQSCSAHSSSPGSQLESADVPRFQAGTRELPTCDGVPQLFDIYHAEEFREQACQTEVIIPQHDKLCDVWVAPTIGQGRSAGAPHSHMGSDEKGISVFHEDTKAKLPLLEWLLLDAETDDDATDDGISGLSSVEDASSSHTGGFSGSDGDELEEADCFMGSAISSNAGCSAFSMSGPVDVATSNQLGKFEVKFAESGDICDLPAAIRELSAGGTLHDFIRHMRDADPQLYRALCFK